MKLRVFWSGLTTTELSANYQDYECDHWEIIGNLIMIHQPEGARFLPLVGIKSFKEIYE